VFGRWVFFENLKGPRPLNFKKSFSAAKDKQCSLSIFMGLPLQIADSGKPII
jgi:hypothetical protein